MNYIRSTTAEPWTHPFPTKQHTAQIQSVLKGMITDMFSSEIHSEFNRGYHNTCTVVVHISYNISVIKAVLIFLVSSEYSHLSSYPTSHLLWWQQCVLMRLECQDSEVQLSWPLLDIERMTPLPSFVQPKTDKILFHKAGIMFLWQYTYRSLLKKSYKRCIQV